MASAANSQAKPKTAQDMVQLADDYMYVSGNYRQAKFMYEMAVDTYPDDPEALSHFANLLRFIDQPSSALVYLEKALVINPVHVFALYTQVRVYRALGYKYQAMNDFHRTLRLDIFDTRTFQQQAAAATAVGWYALSEQVCKKQIALHPTDASLWYTSAVNEQEQHHYQKADYAYTQSLLYRPAHADALRRRSFCRKKLKQWAESKADIISAEQLNPTLNDFCYQEKMPPNPSSHD